MFDFSADWGDRGRSREQMDKGAIGEGEAERRGRKKRSKA